MPVSAAPLTLRQRFSLRRFFRGHGPVDAPLRLDRRRIYILPTRAGLGFALLLLFMLIGAINYNNSLAYLLTFLLTSVSVVAILHTYRGLPGLRLSLGPPPAVFAGEPVQVPVFVDNTAGPARYALVFAFPGGAPVRADLGADQITRIDLSWPSLHRGRHRIGRFTVSTRFPLSLFRAWSPVELYGDVLVYPRPAPATPLPALGRYQPDLSGDQGAGADDFAGFRPYHPGDSLRHVHWKAFARGQELLTKRFGGDRAESLWLDWAATRGDTETRLSVLCRWVLEAERVGLHYGLRLPGPALAGEAASGSGIEPAHGPAHRHRCLSELALYAVAPTQAPTQAPGPR